jgi:hypothetical protein
MSLFLDIILSLSTMAAKLPQLRAANQKGVPVISTCRIFPGPATRISFCTPKGLALS